MKKEKRYKCKSCQKKFAYKKCVFNHHNKKKHEGLVVVDKTNFLQ